MSDGALDLFGSGATPLQPAIKVNSFDLQTYRLKDLAAQEIFIGTSSWKYPG